MQRSVDKLTSPGGPLSIFVHRLDCNCGRWDSKGRHRFGYEFSIIKKLLRRESFANLEEYQLPNFLSFSDFKVNPKTRGVEKVTQEFNQNLRT